MSDIWPIVLIVASNILYQICAKSVPKDMDVMASMTVTYLVGAVCSGLMFFAMNRTPHLLQECSKLNAAPILLGISVVGLEVGYIYAYKVGWPVSIASTVQSDSWLWPSFSSERFYTTKRSLPKKSSAS